MKTTLLLILTVLLGCSTINLTDISKYSDEDLIPIQIDEKWGFINKDFKQIIEPKYDSVGFFYNGIAKIKVDNKYGLLRKNNSYLLRPKYSQVDEFHNNYSQISKGQKSRYIDSEGKEIENLSLAGGYCWGTINSIHKGQITNVNGYYELVYEKIKRIDTSFAMTYDTTNLKADTIIDYSNDYIQIVKNQKIGITKFNHQFPNATIIEQDQLKYDSIVIANYYDGSTKYAKIRSNNLWGIINEKGFEVVKTKYLEIITDPIKLRNPIAINKKRIYQNHRKLLVNYDVGKYGYINLYGHEYFER